MVVQQPENFQNSHEEAHTLVTFFASQLTGNTIIRASDTHVLAILLGYLGKSNQEASTGSYIVMDCDSNKNRRLINVTTIKQKLEEARQGLAAALLGYHAFTGCDFTSAFYRLVLDILYVLLCFEI